MIKHLYIKETKCGLKYLGITKRNPYKYKGSGKYWLSYLRSNNIKSKDIHTRVIYSGEDNDYFHELAEFVSEELDVVNSNYFANLIIETGKCLIVATPEMIESKRERMKSLWMDGSYRDSMTGENHPMYGVKRPDTKKRNLERFKNKNERLKISERSKKRWQDPAYRDMMSSLVSGEKNPSKRKEVAKKISETKKRKFKSGELKHPGIKSCISPDGTVYSSIKEASEATGIPRYSISRYCRSEKNDWKYKTE